MNKRIFILLLILLPAICSLCFKVIYTSNIVIDGKKLALIQEEISFLEEENNLLSLRIAEKGTISYIIYRSEKLGMQQSKISFMPADDNKLASKP